ncbi:TetR/AcrR family transcriptional regulator [Plantibacter sp. YIM 135347]|uniref:TetR/AcrR family transcriptional regulator n=1 Tax=Plantibacter sp. YIM 135347 TaxID=3423919 RepID=UPI003D32F7A2
MRTPDDMPVKRAHGLATQQALLAAAGTVFSRMAYSQARLKDVADTAGISQGSLFFHFGNKADVANAVLATQQERMQAVLDVARAKPGDALTRLFFLFDGLAELIADDELVQAGIRLSMQPGTGLELNSRAPYTQWIDVTALIVREGVEDGSITTDIDVQRAAQFLNEAFIGAQTLTGLQDSWKSLPQRVIEAQEFMTLFLTTPRA